jgi:hypothetical protein
MQRLHAPFVGLVGGLLIEHYGQSEQARHAHERIRPPRTVPAEGSRLLVLLLFLAVLHEVGGLVHEGVLGIASRVRHLGAPVLELALELVAFRLPA